MSDFHVTVRVCLEACVCLCQRDYLAGIYLIGFRVKFGIKIEQFYNEECHGKSFPSITFDIPDIYKDSSCFILNQLTAWFKLRICTLRRLRFTTIQSQVFRCSGPAG